MIEAAEIVLGLFGLFFLFDKPRKRVISLISNRVGDIEKLASLSGITPLQYEILLLLTEPHKGTATSFHMAHRLDVDESILDREIKILCNSQFVMTVYLSVAEYGVLITPKGKQLIENHHLVA